MKITEQIQQALLHQRTKGPVYRLDVIFYGDGSGRVQLKNASGGTVKEVAFTEFAGSLSERATAAINAITLPLLPPPESQEGREF